MTSNRILARNTVYNVIGQALPMLVALVVMPLLIKHLGTDRFGVLTLAWMVIGYFSLFDLGLGRALTKLVAETIGLNQHLAIPGLFWTSMTLMTILGLMAAFLLALLSPWLVNSILEIPVNLREETQQSFYILSASVPIVIITTGLRGVLEAYQRFGIVNMVRIPMALVTYLGPLVAVAFSESLVPVVAILSVARLIALFVHLELCRRVVPGLYSAVEIEKGAIKPLLRFGGWMTVSNLVSPLMVYLDRFLIGSLVSIAAVAYYCTPYEVVTKLSLISGALVGVLFPAFSTGYVQDPQRTAELFGRGVKYTFLAVFPLSLIIVMFAQEGLGLWIGSEFAEHGSRVMQLLAVGVLINSLATIPLSLIQGTGHPDLAAKLHLIELPCYLACLWLLLSSYGINGAALAWLLRVAVDAACMFWFAGRILPAISFSFARTLLVVGGTGLLFALCFIEATLSVRAVAISMTFSIMLPVVWFFFLSPEERDWRNVF